MAKVWTRSRRLSQLFFSGLFVYILWSTTYPLTGKLPPALVFQADPLIMFGTALSERLVLPGMGWAVLMIAGGLILGRFFCGWMCPLGAVIDLLGKFGCRRGREQRDARLRPWRGVKYLILAAGSLFALAGIQIVWLFDPVVLAARFVSLNLIPTATLALDTLLMLLIRGLKLYGPLFDFYNMLRSNVLGVKVAYVAHAGVMFGMFALAAGSALLAPRAWCRLVCPLGALYGWVSRRAWLRRTVTTCVSCGICRAVCPTGAIAPDMVSYEPAECVLCMKCVDDCPANVTRFSLTGWTRRQRPVPLSDAKGVSRRSFLVLLAAAIGAAWGARSGRRQAADADAVVIRPPGALEEREFLNRCVRCGNCMKVCPTNGLQPLLLHPSPDALWTPQLAADIGYCEYNCIQCAAVCPTGAIPRLDLKHKQRTKLGTAKIDRRVCLPYAEKKSCLVCEEHCPVPQKAIKREFEIVDGVLIGMPVVDEELCIGCGICQTKCPVRPVRAIRVFPDGSDRTPV